MHLRARVLLHKLWPGFCNLIRANTNTHSKENHTMRVIFTGTFAAFVLGAAIASSQTQQPSGTQQQGAGGQSQTQSDTQRQGNQSNQKQTTIRGYLRGSAASGWTITPVGTGSGAGASGSTAAGGTTSGAGGTSSAGTATYMVVAPTGGSVNLANMADQCVEIVGSLAPETGAGSSAGRSTSGSSGAGTAGAGAGTSTGTAGTSTGTAGTSTGGTSTGGGATAGAGTSTGGGTTAGAGTTSAGGGTTAGAGTSTGAGTTAGAGGNTSRSTTGNTSGNMSSQSHRTLNVTTIRAAQGGCTQ
jgi:hypothetical protein